MTSPRRQIIKRTSLARSRKHRAFRMMIAGFGRFADAMLTFGTVANETTGAIERFNAAYQTICQPKEG